MQEPTLRIQLLGEFSISYAGEQVSGLYAERPQSLLAYLLLHRDAPQTRQHLAFQLWPDSSEAQARTNLRNLLFTLRQMLPDADRFLEITQATVQWRVDAPYWLDVASFQALLLPTAAGASTQQRLEQAVALYEGDLLPGNYDDWFVPLREELRQQYRKALHELIERLTEAREYAPAIHYGQRLLVHDPLHEDTYVLLMRLHAYCGERAAVRRIYEQCKTMLRREMEAEPAAATAAAYRHFIDMEVPAAPLLQATAPAAAELCPRPSNLPEVTTAFIGRRQELTEIRRLFSDPACRLLTIVGPGGAGKTRLALQAAKDQTKTFADGVTLVSLASVTQAESVAPAIAAALGRRFSGAAPAEDELLPCLARCDLLLVLDNMEHLLDAAPLLARILQHAPQVRLLVTSRERLRLQDEWVLQLCGLAVPSMGEQEDVSVCDSVLLFLERARRVKSSFVLMPQNQSLVAQICRRLDGLPLALELAAAQVAFLSPAELLQRLDHALPLLVDGPRDLPPRQRTMHAAIAWSYDLLPPAERLLLARLATFRGGFSLDAAEAVVVDAELQPEQVLALLRRLVEQSLVVREEHDDETRFRLLEPIRQYAAQQLSPSAAVMVCNQHADFFRSLAQTAELELQSARQIAWLARLERETANLRVAMEWLLERGDHDRATQLCWALWLFLWMRGGLREGQRWIKRILAPSEAAPPTVRERALRTAMVIGVGLGDYAWAASFRDECLAINEELGEPVNLAHATSLAALSLAGLELAERAEPLMELGVDRYLAVGANWNAAMLLTYWAAIPRKRGDYRQARKLTQHAFSLAQAHGDRVTMYSSLFNLASLAQAQEAHDEAQNDFRAALALAVEVGDSGNIISCLRAIGEVAAAQHDLAYAIRLWGAAEALQERNEAAIYSYAADQTEYSSLVARVRQHLDAERWSSLWEEGRAWSFTETLDHALQVDPALGGHATARLMEPQAPHSSHQVRST